MVNKVELLVSLDRRFFSKVGLIHGCLVALLGPFLLAMHSRDYCCHPPQLHARLTLPSNLPPHTHPRRLRVRLLSAPENQVTAQV